MTYIAFKKDGRIYVRPYDRDMFAIALYERAQVILAPYKAPNETTARQIAHQFL